MLLRFLGHRARLVEAVALIKLRATETRRVERGGATVGHLANHSSVLEAVTLVNFDNNAVLIVPDNF